MKDLPSSGVKESSKKELALLLVKDLPSSGVKESSKKELALLLVKDLPSSGVKESSKKELALLLVKDLPSSGVKESSKTELALLLVKDLPSIACGSRFTHFKGLYYIEFVLKVVHVYWRPRSNLKLTLLEFLSYFSIYRNPYTCIYTQLLETFNKRVISLIRQNTLKIKKENSQRRIKYKLQALLLRVECF